MVPLVLDPAWRAPNGFEKSTDTATLIEVAKVAVLRPVTSLGFLGILESRGKLSRRIRRLIEEPLEAFRSVHTALPSSIGEHGDRVWVHGPAEFKSLQSRLAAMPGVQVVSRPRLVTGSGVTGTISVLRATNLDGRTIHLGPVCEITSVPDGTQVNLTVKATLRTAAQRPLPHSQKAGVTPTLRRATLPLDASRRPPDALTSTIGCVSWVRTDDQMDPNPCHGGSRMERGRGSGGRRIVRRTEAPPHPRSAG
jgi:hypothetical protein